MMVKVNFQFRAQFYFKWTIKRFLRAGVNLQFVPCPSGQIIFLFCRQGTVYKVE